MGREPILEISPGWEDSLRRAGLESFAKLMALEGAQRVSHHKRRDAHRIVLDDGRAVFLKRNFRTQIKHVLADVIARRRAQPLVVKEARGIRLAAAAGATTAEIIAIAQRRRWSLPHQGVLLLSEVVGEAMDVRLGKPGHGAGALVGVGRIIAKLYRAGLSWPDLHPKHVFLSQDAKVSLVDLERLRQTPSALRELPAHLSWFCRSMRQCGANERDMRSLLEGLCQAGGLEGEAMGAIVLGEGAAE